MFLALVQILSADLKYFFVELNYSTVDILGEHVLSILPKRPLGYKSVTFKTLLRVRLTIGEGNILS